MLTYLTRLAPLLLATTVGFFPESYGQDGTAGPAYANVIPPSPHAAVFQKYGDYPVSYETGLPQISIPLYTIKENQFSLPITLSYHASGRSTSMAFSSVGLNWALNTGGVISREVYGRPDDLPTQAPPFPLAAIEPLPNNFSAVQEMSFDNPSVFDTSRDSEYDIFTYNLNGQTGKFILIDGRPVMLTTNPFKIQVISENYLQMTDDHGIVYLFGNQLGDAYGGVEFPESVGGGTNYSSWFLNTISLPTGESIKFKYSTLFSQQGTTSTVWGNASVAEQYTINDVGANPFPEFVHLYNVTGFSDYMMSYITEIDFTTGSMLFTYDGGFKLTTCTVKDNNGKRLWGFNFSYQSLAGESLPNNNSILLSGLDLCDSSGSASEHYLFTYNQNPPGPAPNWSFPKEGDWWGYSNGVTGNNIPSFTAIPDPAPGQGTSSPVSIGSSTAKTPSFAFKSYGMLTAIQYPTGGSAQFVYEPNKYLDINGVLTEGPGNRIQQIILDDGMGNKTTKLYRYGNNENGAGVLLYQPNAADYASEGYVINYQTNNNYGYRSRIFSSQRNPEVSDAYSYPVYYPQVTEYQTNTNQTQFNGKTIYTFSTPTLQTYTIIPLPGWMGGHDGIIRYKPVYYVPYTDPAPAGKMVFQYANGVYNKISEDDYTYSDFNDTSINEVFIARYVTITGSSIPNDPSVEQAYAVPPQSTPIFVCGQVVINAGARRVVTETHSDIENGQYLTSTKTYQYGNLTDLYPTKVTATNSRGELLTTIAKYPLDYSNVTAADPLSAGIKTLIATNTIAEPIEESSYRSNADGSNSRLMSSTLTAYKSSVPLKDNVWMIEANRPLTDFTPSSVQGGAVAKDSRYVERLSFDSYNPFGGLTEQHKTGDLSYSYLWDYKNSCPVAEIVNADTGSVAFTSFEADGNGRWTIPSTSRDVTTPALTGAQSYILSNGSLSCNGLNSTMTYTLSYWTRNGSAYAVAGTQAGYPIQGRSVNGWTYFEHKISGVSSVTVSGSGNIDEVRLYPTAAQMTTFTYIPLLGIASTCDPASHITYNTYDAMGRLSSVRDQDGNVVKKISYTYNQNSSQENLQPVYANASLTQSYTCACTGGQVGSLVSYTVPAGNFISTISQADADQQAANAMSTYGQINANANGTCTTPVPTSTIQLSYAVTGITSSSPITAAFKQGSTTVSTASFPRTSSGPITVTLPSGTYQITFTMPSAYSGHILTFSLNTGQSWNSDGTTLSVNSDNVTFVANTTYTFTVTGQ